MAKKTKKKKTTYNKQIMAKTTTFYEFKAKLKDLDLLNAKLKEAQVNLKGLQKNTSEYAALSSQIGGITKQIDNNKKSIGNFNLSQDKSILMDEFMKIQKELEKKKEKNNNNNNKNNNNNNNTEGKKT